MRAAMALLAIRLKQRDQAMHGRKVTLEGARVLTVEECTGQPAPVGLMRRTRGKEPTYTSVCIGDLGGDSCDRYCSRYLVGSRGKSEPSTGSSNVGFRCVKSAQ
jgi:hypothetical protein